MDIDLRENDEANRRYGDTMTTGFSASESEKLGYYVYLYSDPRNDRPFYVGKGRGNRAFAHLNDASVSAKVARIKEIRAEGIEPRIEILAFGLDEVTAFKVEAAAIDLIGFENLTNAVLGRGARQFGRMGVDEVHARLGSEPVDRFDDECILIKLNNTYADAVKRSVIDLYDATRGTWKLSIDRARRAKFALAVFGGVVREVYEIAEWLPAGSTIYVDPNRDLMAPGRFEFVGRVAPEPVRKRYRWKSVAHLYKPGAANPIMYAGPANS